MDVSQLKDQLSAQVARQLEGTREITDEQVRQAAQAAWQEQGRAKQDIRDKGRQLLEEMAAQGGRGIVLAGRPYHIDPEINHGIPEMITSYGLTVFTEDSLPIDFTPSVPCG